MNASDDPTQDELARRLDRLAATIELRPAALDAVRHRGEQRNRRRRTTIGTLSVVAVIGTSIGGIVALSRPTDPTVSNHAADEADTPSPSTGDAPTATGDGNTTDATASDATTGPTPIAGSAPPVAAGTAVATAVPLDLVDPQLTWNVVRPDSTQALAYPAFLSGVSPTASPLYAWSSAPGRDSGDSGVGTLYRSDDGITWSAVGDADLPWGTAASGVLPGSEGELFAVSTAPATASGEAPASTGSTGDSVVSTPDNSDDLRFWTRDADGGWSSTPVPLDLEVWHDVPGVLGTTIGELSTSTLDHGGEGSLVLLAKTRLLLDVSAVSANADGVNVTPDGVDILHYDAACGDVVTETTMVVGGVAGTDATEVTTVDSPCLSPTTEHRDLAELDVDQRALDEYFAPPHLFVLSAAGSLAEVPFPGEVEPGLVVSGARVIGVGDEHALLYDELDPTTSATVRTRLWLSADGESWEEHLLPAQAAEVWSLSIGRLADGRLAGVSMWSIDASSPVVFVEDGAGGWTVTDLAGALRPDDGRSATLSPNAAVVGDTGITVAALISVDPFVEHGPVSTTDGDRTITQIDAMGTYVVTSTDTGEEIARFELGSPTAFQDGTLHYDEVGDLVLADPATGDELARLSQAVQMRLSELAYGTEMAPDTIVLHSVDGTAWSRESLTDLSSGTSTWINGLASIDGRVVGSFLDPGTRNDDGSPATFVLVGTPNE